MTAEQGKEIMQLMLSSRHLKPSSQYYVYDGDDVLVNNRPFLTRGKLFSCRMNSAVRHSHDTVAITTLPGGAVVFSRREVRAIVKNSTAFDRTQTATLLQQ